MKITNVWLSHIHSVFTLSLARRTKKKRFHLGHFITGVEVAQQHWKTAAVGKNTTARSRLSFVGAWLSGLSGVLFLTCPFGNTSFPQPCRSNARAAAMRRSSARAAAMQQWLRAEKACTWPARNYSNPAECRHKTRVALLFTVIFTPGYARMITLTRPRCQRLAFKLVRDAKQI